MMRAGWRCEGEMPPAELEGIIRLGVLLEVCEFSI